MPERDEPMEMDDRSADPSVTAVLSILVIALIVGAGFLLWTQTDSGKADRLAGMREACAAGRAEPLNCAKEGVHMEWAVKGEPK